MNEKLMEWKDQWNNGDVKFVPELFELVEKLQFEKDVAVEGFRGQFELANAAIEQNDDLREQLKQANKQIQELESEMIVHKSVNNSI